LTAKIPNPEWVLAKPVRLAPPPRNTYCANPKPTYPLPTVDKIKQYLSLSKEGRFHEALPLIEEIVHRNPEIPTSQFNYGICLAELKRHKEAAAAFFHAYTLDPNDGGALYRGCLSLAEIGDESGLLTIFTQECARDPQMIHNFVGEEKFQKLWERPDFTALRDEYET
jgi:tetratricopeptide (TPR) repeat protein